MRRRFNAQVVHQASRYCPDLDLLYLNNPKAACSSIKEALWLEVDKRRGTSTYVGNPHSRNPEGPFVFSLLTTAGVAEGLERATAFSMVRNPYSRILASYLDKVGRDPWVWHSYARRFGIPETATQEDFSFTDFLATICREPDELLDPHFRPQYLNLLMPLIQAHVIGFVEAPDSVSNFLRDSHGIELGRHSKDETNSAQLLQRFYTDELVDIVRNRYAADFSAFGYSDDIARADEPGVLPVQPEPSLAGLITPCRTGAFDPERLDQTQNNYADFTAAVGIRARFAIAERAWRDEDNWSCLRAYTATALIRGDFALGSEMVRRLYDLRGEPL